MIFRKSTEKDLKNIMKIINEAKIIKLISGKMAILMRELF